MKEGRKEGRRGGREGEQEGMGQKGGGRKEGEMRPLAWSLNGKVQRASPYREASHSLPVSFPYFWSFPC